MEYGVNDWRNAIFEAELNTATKLVALAIAKYWRPDKPCYPSLSTIMSDCSIKSKHTVIKAISELKENGLIKVKKGEIKYLSSMQNFYELVGVNSGADNGASNGAVNGASNGAVNGALNAPEIREEENMVISNNKKINKKVFSKEFEEWWKEVPRKVSKDAAYRKFNTLLAAKIVTFDELIEGMKRYAEHCREENTEEQYIKHPSTWLNGGCWKDEYKKKRSIGDWLERKPHEIGDWL